MSTTEDIRRELSDLDAEFASEENSKTGRLKLPQYTEKRAALLRRLNAPQRIEVAKSKDDRPLSRADLNSLLSSPPGKGLSAADKAELDAFQRDFDRAVATGNIEEARAVSKNERRQELSWKTFDAPLKTGLAQACKQFGARAFAPFMVDVIGALYHELNETRVAAQVHRAHADDLEQRLRVIEARAERAVTHEQLEAQTTKWALDFERRFSDIAQRAVDAIPRPQDGMSLDNFDMALEGRTLTLQMACGDRVVSKEIKVPFLMDRGIYRHKTAYEKGDVVTYGGSLWVAIRENPTTKPPSDDWRLCVQRGRDAR